MKVYRFCDKLILDNISVLPTVVSPHHYQSGISSKILFVVIEPRKEEFPRLGRSAPYTDRLLRTPEHRSLFNFASDTFSVIDCLFS